MRGHASIPNEVDEEGIDEEEDTNEEEEDIDEEENISASSNGPSKAASNESSWVEIKVSCLQKSEALPKLVINIYTVDLGAA